MLSLLSSDNVSHRTHKFVRGTREAGLGSTHLQSVGGMRGAEANPGNCHLRIKYGLTGKHSRRCIVVKNREEFWRGDSFSC